MENGHTVMSGRPWGGIEPGPENPHARTLITRPSHLLIFVKKFGTVEYSNFINGLTGLVMDYFCILVNGFGFNRHKKLTD